MRVIEKQMCQKIREGKNWKKSNTEIKWSGENTVEIYLHGNLIIEFQLQARKCYLYNRGWASNTTKSRLNAFLSEFFYGLHVGIYQKNWNWYVNFEEWDYSNHTVKNSKDYNFSEGFCVDAWHDYINDNELNKPQN